MADVFQHAQIITLTHADFHFVLAKMTLSLVGAGHMTMLQTRADRANTRGRPLGQVVDLLDTLAVFGESSSQLVDENRSGESSTSHKRALRARDSDVIADDGEQEGRG